MTLKIISGGQTGADQAGLRAAKRFGLIGDFGGWMPKGWLTEDGPRPEYAGLYGMKEIDRSWLDLSEQYKVRTKANVSDSDLTILFGDPTSRGGRATYSAFRAWSGESGKDPGINYCRRGWIAVPRPDSWPSPADVARMIRTMGAKVVNIAGNRESKAPGIEAWVEAYLCEVFRAMGYLEIEST